MWWLRAGRELAPTPNSSRSRTVGLEPQDLKYKGEPTETVIGPRTRSANIVVHRGTVTGTGITRIGADCC